MVGTVVTAAGASVDVDVVPPQAPTARIAVATAVIVITRPDLIAASFVLLKRSARHARCVRFVSGDGLFAPGVLRGVECVAVARTARVRLGADEMSDERLALASELGAKHDDVQRVIADL
ncbi:hypothetical protein [Tsukamurella soli]